MLAGKAKAWLDTTSGSWVKSYIDYGFAVFPCHGITKEGECTCGKVGCANAGKHPYTAHGLKDATKDIAQAEALWNGRDDLNIAIATGEPSGIFIVDIDNRGDVNGEASLLDLEQQNGKLPVTMTSITGSGRHLIFKMPGVPVKSSASIVKGVDIRGTGGYIIAPPSTHNSGAVYTFSEDCDTIAEAPEWLLNAINKKRERKVKHVIDAPSYSLDSWSKDDVWDMLSHISPDIEYDDWLHVGMALHQGGYPISLWDSWSRSGSKYQNGDCENRWGGFCPSDGITMGTLVDMAMLGGWKPKPLERPAIDTSKVMKMVASAQQKMAGGKVLEKVRPLWAEVAARPKKQVEPVTKVSRDPAFPFDPAKIPGIIGDTVAAITKYALYKQPELAYLNTLAAAGAVFGRRYASPMNARTNIYLVGVARTAGGKDFSRQYISNLFEAAGLQEYMGAHYIRSDVGMLVSMQTHPSQIIMLDEFGMYMEALANQRAPLHIKNVTSCLTKLFTSSGTSYDHGATADSKSRIIIQRPNLCIYGTTTEETYANSLKRSAIASGDLNRFLVFKSTRKFTGREERPPAYAIEKILINEWKKYGLNEGGLPNLADFPPEPEIVEWSDAAYAIIGDCMVKQNDMLNNPTGTSELYGRYAELVTKIAMILAIGENRMVPHMEVRHVETARQTVDTCLEYMVGLANERVADSEYEEIQQRITVYLRRHKDGVAMNELSQNFRSVRSRERREILADMMGQGVIEMLKEVREGEGRPREIIRLVG